MIKTTQKRDQKRQKQNRCFELVRQYSHTEFTSAFQLGKRHPFPPTSTIKSQTPNFENLPENNMRSNKMSNDDKTTQVKPVQ